MVTLTLTAVPDVPLGDATPTGVVRLHLRDSRPIDKNNKIDEHLRGSANRLNQPWLMGVFLTPGAFHRHRINNAPPHKHHINVRYVRMQPRCHYYSTGCLKLVRKKKEKKNRGLTAAHADVWTKRTPTHPSLFNHSVKTVLSLGKSAAQMLQVPIIVEREATGTWDLMWATQA